MTLTENGAATYISTKSHCLDLFGTIGAIRNSTENDIIDRFVKAYSEDKNLAVKTLFFIRKNTISCPVIPNHKKANTTSL